MLLIGDAYEKFNNCLSLISYITSRLYYIPDVDAHAGSVLEKNLTWELGYCFGSEISDLLTFGIWTSNLFFGGINCTSIHSFQVV